MVRTARLTGELYGSEMQQAFEICNSKLKVEVVNFVMYLVF